MRTRNSRPVYYDLPLDELPDDEPVDFLSTLPEVKHCLAHDLLDEEDLGFRLLRERPEALSSSLRHRARAA